MWKHNKYLKLQIWIFVNVYNICTLEMCKEKMHNTTKNHDMMNLKNNYKTSFYINLIYFYTLWGTPLTFDI